MQWWPLKGSPGRGRGLGLAANDHLLQDGHLKEQLSEYQDFVLLRAETFAKLQEW
jgi:hypothetical protein